MKILYIVNYFPPSLSAASVIESKIVEYLSNFGHELLILSPKELTRSSELKNGKFKQDFDNYNIHYSSSFFKYPFSFIFSHFENMFKFLIKLKNIFIPDIIFSQFHPHHYASVIGGYLSRIMKIPHIIRSHDLFIVDQEEDSLFYQLYNYLIYPPIHKSIYRSKCFFVTTNEMKNHLLKFKKLREKKIKVNYNGVDTNLFYPYKNQDTLKQKYGCENIIIFIGTIIKKYGLHNFLHTLPEVLKSYKDTHFILIGHGPDINYYLNYIKMQNIQNQCHFIGVKPNHAIPFFINNSDIGIGRFSRSKYVQYCMPTKCIEYMACKKSFLTTPISKDIVNNNDTGFVIRSNFTQKELIQKLSMLIEDNHLRTKLGNAGLKKIQEKFKWDIIIQKLNKEIVQE